MRIQLFSKGVITSDQKNIIDKQIGREKMEYLLIEIIMCSLNANCSEKYKLFLKVMEENEDIDLQRTAKMLVGCLLYRTVIIYIYSYYIVQLYSVAN